MGDAGITSGHQEVQTGLAGTRMITPNTLVSMMGENLEFPDHRLPAASLENNVSIRVAYSLHIAGREIGFRQNIS